MNRHVQLSSERCRLRSHKCNHKCNQSNGIVFTPSNPCFFLPRPQPFLSKEMVYMVCYANRTHLQRGKAALETMTDNGG